MALGTGRITTVAGGALTDSTGDGLSANSRKLFRPTGLALASGGDYLYISDSVAQIVYRLDLTTRLIVGGLLNTISGFGRPKAPLQHMLRSPQGLVLTGSGQLYIADRGHETVRQVNLSSATCPVLDAFSLDCGSEGLILERCEALDCCFDRNCGAGLNQDCIGMVVQCLDSARWTCSPEWRAWQGTRQSPSCRAAC